MMRGMHIERAGRVLPALVGALAFSLLSAAGCARTMPGAVDVSAENVTSLEQEFVLSSGGTATVQVEVPEPDGFATLRGRIVLAGSLSGTLVALSPDKDLRVCGANVIPNEALVIGSDSGIQNVMLYVETRKFKIPVGDPKWEHQEYLDQKDAVLDGANAFNQESCRFLSHVFAMRATQTLTILNSDTVGHNTDLQSASGLAARSNYQVPGSGSVVYSPGYKSKAPFKVSCGAHGWMTAYIHVSDHPFFAVSGEDGSFQIKHVPSGVPLEFRIWHESANKPGTVTVNDSQAEYSKGKLTRTFSADEEVDWTIELDASNFNHLFN